MSKIFLYFECFILSEMIFRFLYFEMFLYFRFFNGDFS